MLVFGGLFFIAYADDFVDRELIRARVENNACRDKVY